MNSIISWVGGKKALRELIYLRMPKEFGRYIEVFGGGGWVLFGRPTDAVMEVYNDFNSDLTNLFRCAKEQTLALIQELNFLPLNGRDEFGVLRRYLEKQEFTSEYLSEELELAERHFSPLEYEDIRQILTEKAVMNDVKRAAAFFKLIRYSYGSGCTSFGWTYVNTLDTES
nr:DNA adenine methylase [[Clostridium] methoxybenzovorans]